MKQSTLIYHLTAFLVVAIWGSTFVCTKILLVNGLTAAQIFTLRFIIAYVLLLAFSLTRRSFRCWADTWRDELIMAALGLTGGTLYFLTENSAMNYTTTTNTSLIVCCCPLFAGCDRRGAQRPFRAPSLTHGRRTGVGRQPVLGSLLTTDDSRQQALRCGVHHP